MDKIKVYGIQIAVIGSNLKENIYFKTESERAEYARLTPNPYSLLRTKNVHEDALMPLTDWGGAPIYPGAYWLN